MSKNRTMAAKNLKVKRCMIADRKERDAITMIDEKIFASYDCVYPMSRIRHSQPEERYVYQICTRKGLFEYVSTRLLAPHTVVKSRYGNGIITLMKGGNGWTGEWNIRP